jgi:hypothetical protein
MDNWEWKRKFAEEQAAMREEEERWDRKLASLPTPQQPSNGKAKAGRKAKPKGAGKRVSPNKVRHGLMAREADAFRPKPKPS